MDALAWQLIGAETTQTTTGSLLAYGVAREDHYCAAVVLRLTHVNLVQKLRRAILSDQISTDGKSERLFHPHHGTSTYFSSFPSMKIPRMWPLSWGVLLYGQVRPQINTTHCTCMRCFACRTQVTTNSCMTAYCVLRTACNYCTFVRSSML